MNKYSKTEIPAKKRLTEAAAQVMREKDSVHLTLQEVSARSGLNAGLVKYHFGNKEGLLFAVLLQAITEGLDALERLTERDDLGPAGKLELHISGMVEAYSRAPYLHRLIQLLTNEGSKDREQYIANEVINKIAAGQRSILDAGMEAGVFRKIDQVSFYFHLVGAAEGLYAHSFVLNSAFGIETIDKTMHRRNVEQITQIIMRGVLVDPEGDIL